MHYCEAFTKDIHSRDLNWSGSRRKVPEGVKSLSSEKRIGV